MTSIRIVFISDTHNYHSKVVLPEGDFLIHTGDATSVGHEWEVKSFGKWFSSQPHKYKLFTPGNHERSSERTPEEFIEWLGFDDSGKDGCYYLHNQTVELEGLKIFMSGVTPTFGYSWAWNVDRGPAIAKVWAKIEESSHLILTHGPNYEILDWVEEWGWFGDEKHPFKRHVGCQDLLEVVKRIKPLIHACGHLHAPHGYEKHGDTLFINASTCTEEYKPLNPPIVVDIEKIDDKWEVIDVFKYKKEEEI